MVSHDAAWWRAHPEVDFTGQRFTAHPEGLHEFGAKEFKHPAGNSGTLGIEVAMHLGATRVLLLGCDLKGTHYFGPHGAGLKNTTLERFKVFHLQYAARRHLPVINCSPDSELDCFPRGNLMDELNAHGMARDKAA
jgi:hypothetical protein